MDSSQKTRILIGALGVAVVALLVYALTMNGGSAPKPASAGAATPAGGGQAPGGPAPESKPLEVELTLEVPAQVGADSSGHQARAVCVRELGYAWTIFGGTFEGAAEGPMVQWKAGSGKEVILVCTGKDDEGRSTLVSQRIPVLPKGSISRFEALPPLVSEGGTARLYWEVQGAARITLEPGGQDLTEIKGRTVDLKPEKTTTYVLTVTGATGDTATAEQTVKVIPPPQITTFRAELGAGAPKRYSVLAEFKGGKAELKRGAVVLAKGDASPLQVQVPDPGPGSVVELTVTSESGSYATSRITFPAKK